MYGAHGSRSSTHNTLYKLLLPAFVSQPVLPRPPGTGSCQVYEKCILSPLWRAAVTALKGVTTRGHRWQQERRGVRAANMRLARHGLCYAAGINEAAQPTGLIDTWRDAQLRTSPDSCLHPPHSQFGGKFPVEKPLGFTLNPHRSCQSSHRQQNPESSANETTPNPPLKGNKELRGGERHLLPSGVPRDCCPGPSLRERGHVVPHAGLGHSSL